MAFSKSLDKREKMILFGKIGVSTTKGPRRITTWSIDNMSGFVKRFPRDVSKRSQKSRVVSGKLRLKKIHCSKGGTNGTKNYPSQ
jgi:hypothetical protein